SRRELREAALREGANHDAVDPALEIARDVFDGLAVAECDFRRRLDDLTTELPDCNHERRARPERRFLEEQRDVTAGERLVGGVLRGAAALHVGGERKDAVDLAVA